MLSLLNLSLCRWKMASFCGVDIVILNWCHCLPNPTIISSSRSSCLRCAVLDRIIHRNIFSKRRSIGFNAPCNPSRVFANSTSSSTLGNKLISWQISVVSLTQSSSYPLRQSGYGCSSLLTAAAYASCMSRSATEGSFIMMCSSSPLRSKYIY